METEDELQSVHQPHDKGYKYLLSSKRLFLELLQTFVKRGWVEQIEESDLVPVDKSYILPDFSEKEADLVYRVRFKGQEVIFYILMEMQSTVDYQMPYRLLLYQVEIWRDVLKNADKEEAARKTFRLPPIVPIVLYNGEAAWTAAQSFREDAGPCGNIRRGAAGLSLCAARCAADWGAGAAGGIEYDWRGVFAGAKSGPGAAARSLPEAVGGAAIDAAGICSSDL